MCAEKIKIQAHMYDEEIKSKHVKDSEECWFIMTQIHNPQMFGVIPFVNRPDITAVVDWA